jgi:signal transduction histidine kinase
MSQSERRTPDSDERIDDLPGRLITAQEAERARIARDLHDGVCQELAALSVDLSYLRQRGCDMARHECEAALLSLERRTAAIAEVLRRQSQCAEIERRFHLDVSFFAAGVLEPIDPRTALALFRIAQEALSNAARHAHARHITMSLARGESTLSMSVADDGTGFDVGAVRNGGGLGLVSMEERVRLVQGRVAIRSERNAGTVIDVCVPAPAESAREPA